MPRRPALVLVVLCAIATLGSCSDGNNPLGPTFGVQLEVNFDVSAVWAHIFDPADVQRIRATATVAATGDTLGTVEATFDAQTDAWTVDLDATPGNGVPVPLIVELELLSGTDVQWSGRSPPITGALSATPTPMLLTLFRGPLANLTVTNLTMTGAPATLDEGASAQLTATVTGSDPAVQSDIRVFWSSSDEGVATVDSAGLLTGVSPGTASIQVVAGPAGIVAVVDVEVVPAEVLLDPPTARLTSLTEQLALQATVVDARGDTLSGYAIVWESTDSTVLAPLGGGVFEAASGGDAEVVATVGGVPGAEGRADVEVSQEVAVAVLDADTVRFGALGDQQTLTLVAEDAAGVAIGTLDADWTSSDPSVASVDASGVVTAVDNGTAQVSARVSAAALAERGWSAPVGPPGLAPGMDTVTVAAEVEVSQIVSTVTVAPADSVVLGPGADVQFVAEARDANGMPIVAAAFNWSSSDGGVASIDAAGLASALGMGVTTIEAESDGVSSSTDLTVLTAGGYTRVWIGGDAAGARDWANGANWLPRFVPTIADTVLIQMSAPDQPQLTEDWSVGGLLVEDGASIELAGFQLTVADDLDAGNTIVGPGTVRMIGAGATLQGSLPSLLVNETLVVAGPIDVTGDLTVAGVGVDFDIGANTVTVAGALRIQDGATLTMQDAASVVDVDGEAVFDGTSTLGLLTSGELRVGGNFTAWTSEAENFAPTGSHRTILDGAVVQTLYLHFSGAGQSRFQELEIDNVGGVSLQSPMRVVDVTLTSGALTGAQTVVIEGDVTEAIGGNQYQVLNTTFTGSPALPASLQTNVTFVSAYSVSQDLEVVGDVIVSGSGVTLDVGDNSVTVTGDFRTELGATLTMQDPTGALAVGGEVEFNGGSTLGLLTSGELRVAGDFTAWTSGPLNFAPTVSHRTVLDGSSAQTVYLHNSGPSQARFHDLEVDNSSGVTLLSTLRLTNDLTLTAGTLTGAQTAVIGGDVSEAVGGNQYQVLSTTFTASPSLPPSIQTNALFTTAYTLAQDLTVVGDLMASGSGAGIDVGSNAVSVSGQLRIEDGATLTMQDGSGVLEVSGEAFFDGASTLGLLTAGELRVGGNFTAWTSEPQNFAPTVGHRTVLDGAASQSVYLQYSGVGESRFHDLELDNAAGATLQSTTRVANDVVLTSGTLDGSQTVHLGGDLTEVIGGNQYQVLNTIVTGSPTLPASLQSNVTIASAYSLAQDLDVVGSLMVDGSGATLDIDDHTVTVTGDFRTANGGTLTMQDAAGVLDVEGETEFNGGSTLGLLTAGELQLAGNFTAWTSESENFAPTGAHQTTLDGTAAQTVYLHYSGPNQARFEDLAITNTVGVSFLGTTRVTNALTVSTALTVELGQITLVAGLFTLEAPATLTNNGSLQANSCSLLGTVVGNAPVCP